MSKMVLLRLLATDNDPYFLAEIIVLFGTLISDYFLIMFSNPLNPSFTEETVLATGGFLREFYPFTVLLASFQIFLFANSIEKGKILTYLSMQYDLKSIVSRDFFISVLYPTIVSCISAFASISILSLSVLYESSFVELVFETVFYIGAFTIAATGAGYLVAAITRSSLISTGAVLGFSLFASNLIFGREASSSFIDYSLVGFQKLSSSTPFTTTFFWGAILEFLFGLLFLVFSILILQRINLKGAR